jgi:membrane-associated phospholipid phosphatase
MPGLAPGPFSKVHLVDALRPVGHDTSARELLLDLWLYPASFPLSGLIVAGCAFVLHRRGRTRAAALWLGAWLVANLEEGVSKTLLVRPALHTSAGFHVVAFDQALPSGHTLRSVLAAATVAYVWPRAKAAAIAWAATVPPLLVVAGWHTPTDVAAGLLLAGALVLAVHELARRSRADGRAPAG